MKITCPLWFYWGEPKMSYLRYATLATACKIHDDVRLVIPSTFQENVDLGWAEKLDFSHGGDFRDWTQQALSLPIVVVKLEEIAPDIANLKADGVHTCDILGWWLLATEGGTVCDMDIAFLKPLPKIQHDVELVIHDYPGSKYIPIAYIQGTPCDFWMSTYKTAMSRYDPKVYQSCGASCLLPNVPRETDGYLRNGSETLPEARLSPFVVYPFFGIGYGQILSLCHSAPSWPPIPEGCVGIHWYGGGTLRQNMRINGPEDLTVGATAWAIKETLGL